ncbi:MAG: Gfo/Idh/MocA family oxidoreductase [Planctomycetota bacterium]
MAGKEFRWGLCGCGGFVTTKVIPLLKEIEGARIVKAYDPLPATREKVKSAFGLTTVDSYDAVLDDASIECVYIASPNYLHAPQTIAAAEKGKHVFCQKPMARTADEARPMVDACRKAGVQLGVGFCYRFAGGPEKMKELMREGAIGKPTLVTVEFHLGYTKDSSSTAVAWRCDPKLSGGGPLMDLAPHLVDMARFLMDDEFTSVFSHVDPMKTDTDVEEDTISLLRFSKGARAVIDCTFNARNHGHRIIVNGAKGRLETIRSMCWGPGGILFRSDQAEREMIPIGMHEHIKKEMVLFMDAVRQGKDVPVSGRDGLITNIVIDAIYKSGATGKPVKLDYVQQLF